MGGPFGLIKNHNVPIIGQPFTFKAWFPTVSITCGCEAKESVLIVGQAIAACAACGRGYKVQQIQFDAATGQMNIALGLVTPQPSLAGVNGDGGKES